MTWTYELDFTGTRDQVRRLIGDTVSADPLLQDEEIAWRVLTEPDVTRAAALCCEDVAAGFARKVDGTLGRDAQMALSQKAMAYERMARKLRDQANRVGIVPIWGGTRRSQKEQAREDPDLIPMPFRTEQDTEPGTEGFVDGDDAGPADLDGDGW